MLPRYRGCCEPELVGLDLRNAEQTTPWAKVLVRWPKKGCEVVRWLGRRARRILINSTIEYRKTRANQVEREKKFKEKAKFFSGGDFDWKGRRSAVFGV